MIKYFRSIVDYDFTAKAEAELDEIAEGKLTWKQMLAEFYKNFHPLVEESEKASRSEAAQARELGKDPKTGKPVLVRFGRFGPVLQLGESPVTKDKDAPKPKFAPLPEGTTMEEVTLEQALPMFNLPRIVGKTTAGEEITADIGRFGPYIKVGKSYASIKDYDPLSITENEAREVLAEKVKTEKERNIADFGEIKILRGPYGPYITNGKKNVRIPKDQDPAKLTEPEARKLLDAAPETRERRFKRRRK